MSGLLDILGYGAGRCPGIHPSTTTNPRTGSCCGRST